MFCWCTLPLLQEQAEKKVSVVLPRRRIHNADLLWKPLDAPAESFSPFVQQTFPSHKER